MSEPQEYIIVEAPDGTEIEFPSTMSDDEISNVMRQQYPPGAKFLNVMDKTGMGAPTQEQFRNDILPGVQAKAAGYDYTLRKMGDKIIQNKMSDPENVGWTPGGRDPASFAANKLGRAEGTYLGWGDEALGLASKKAGDFKRNLKEHARFRHPEEFGEGQVEGNVFSGLVTAPVAAPKWLQFARFLPRGTQGLSAGASSAVAWDTLDQMGTSSGSAEQRFRGIDTDRTKTAAGIGGAAGGVLSAFTRTLSNGQSEFARLLEGVVDDAGRVSDDGIRGLERFLADNRITLDDIALGRLDSVIQDARQTSSKALALPVRIKDVLIDAFEDGSGNFRQAVETQLRGTMVEGGDGAARIAESVDEDFGQARKALDDHYGARLGQKSRIKSEDDTLTRLREIGEQGYEPVLSRELTYQDVRDLNEVMSGPGMMKLKSPLEEIAAGEGISLADMIQQHPLRAAHWMQSKARQLSQSKTDEVMASAFTSLRRRLLNVIEDVAPEYKQIRTKYGDEFGNLEALEFGDRFLTNAGKAFEIDKMARAFKKLSAAQKRVALLSVRDVLRSASGRGKKNAPPRLGRVGDEQVLESLETVFGARGARVAQGIEDTQAFVQSRVNVDSRRGSPTAPNQEAVTRAKSAVQSPMRRKVGNLMQNIAGDVAYTTSGFPAVNSIRKSIGKAGEVVSGNVSNKMNSLATLLEAKVARPMAANAAKRRTPIKGPDGRFISNAKARELGLLDDAGNQTEPSLMDRIAAKGKPSERGSIDFEDPDLNRRAQNMARGMAKATQAAKKRRLQQAHADTINQNVGAQEPAALNPSPEPPVMPRRRSGVMESPLLPMLGVGVGGTGAAALYRHHNRPEASTSDSPASSAFIEGIMRNAGSALDDITTRREQGLPKTPGLKPYMDRRARIAIQNANKEAIQAEKVRRQEYWDFLKSKGMGGVIWNKTHEKRLDLKVTPADRGRGIVAKRLVYGYDIPVSSLENAPIEVLIDGEWLPESALEHAK